MTEPTSKAIVEFQHITTCFGTQIVHDDLNLSVKPGEVLAIVGGSGSGKTSLLRELLLLDRPAAGEIIAFGESIYKANGSDIMKIRRRIGMMFQSGALFSGLTVLENICFVLRELTQLDEKLMIELAMIKIALANFPADSVHKYPSQLSGGMVKRAALARAIALDPELLLLDEPTSGLDPESATSLDELVTALHTWLKLTIIMVTHDVDSLWATTDRVAFLGDKKVLACAPMAKLTQDPNPLIQAYFSNPRARGAARSHSKT
jgi:phospholipid/cholesterol/gamma-HCH transport system ATP-binding protein